MGQLDETGRRLAALPIQEQVYLSGRSWWEVMYHGGRTISEWETAGVIRAREAPQRGLWPLSKWEDLDHGRIVAARLWCPDGSIGEVRAQGPHKVFQFKTGSISSAGQSVRAHVLGVVATIDGDCECWAWEPPAGLVRFEDNVLSFQRYQIGALNLDAVGLRL